MVSTWPEGLYQPVYERFLIEAISLGRIQAPGFFDDPLTRMGYQTVKWVTPTPDYVDPYKNAGLLEDPAESDDLSEAVTD